MPPSVTGTATPAQVVYLQTLKSCLVNLPPSLVSALHNSDVVAQDVIVELQFRGQTQSSVQSSRNAQEPPRSAFLGWTGMPSRRKLAPVVNRDGLGGTRGAAVDREIDTVEVDPTFARLLNLQENHKIGIHIHVGPQTAHTIAIEPLTPDDWEMIELHTQFLELNFLSQIRALPNPATSKESPGCFHPLTLHLSPTSTANVLVTKLSPSPSGKSPFAKLSPDAEVHVAPKLRQETQGSSKLDSKGAASVGKRSTAGRSSTSTIRRTAHRSHSTAADPIFLRGIDCAVGGDFIDNLQNVQKAGYHIWVARDVLSDKRLRGLTWVSVSVVKPSGLLEPQSPQKEVEGVQPATRVVARIGHWDRAPDSTHVALSTPLAQSLSVGGMIGGIIRVEPAPAQLPKGMSTEATAAGGRSGALKSLRMLPFRHPSDGTRKGLNFGQESNHNKAQILKEVRRMFGKDGDRGALLEGPLTHGMVLPGDSTAAWNGAIVQFDPPPQRHDPAQHQPVWVLGCERHLSISIDDSIPKISTWRDQAIGEPLCIEPPVIVGIDSLIDQVSAHLYHGSSVLLTGGIGTGKSSLASLLASSLKSEQLYHVTFCDCRSLVGDETRPSSIVKQLERVFGDAAWGARLGGQSLVVLDDIDLLSPVETELQVGGDNSRSRQISESFCEIARQYCSTESGVVVLATAQSKENVNNIVISGHVFREMVNIKALSKQSRREVLESLIHRPTGFDADLSARNGSALARNRSGSFSSHEESPAGSEVHSDGSDSPSKVYFVVSREMDLLDLAGQTDGYSAGDLVLLVSRARGEALVRAVSSDSDRPHLGRIDFQAALEGFTPASLRKVPLQDSTTKWANIGGMHETRQVLLETLQYPTTYAPIFAKCPLRLRSGILLYGYPGCGKTLLASAVAGECGLNFISVKGPEILNKYIGASEKSVRDLFARAEAARPCVLFFDEFDSIAPKRGHDSTGVTDRVVNQMLTQMDGAEGLTGVYVLAATSRPDLIDPALLRPGRLDKSLLCDMPGLGERMDILRAVSSTLKLDERILGTDESGKNIREIAELTEGYSGADIQAVAYNAQLEAIHDALADDDESSLLTAQKPALSGGHTGQSARDFMLFRYGEAQSETDETEKPAAIDAERIRYAHKLDKMQTTRRLQRQARLGLTVPTPAGNAGPSQSRTSEPVIEWRHVALSLRNTKASITPEERRRLGSIYREFVVGRNGELPDGQGLTDVGARTSLM